MLLWMHFERNRIENEIESEINMHCEQWKQFNSEQNEFE